MSFPKLFDPRDSTYFAENGLSENSLLFFLHIPKTAGSSFGSEMQQRLSPAFNIIFDYRNADIPVRYQEATVFQQFLSQDRASRFRFASGHVRFQTCASLLALERKVRMITFLRDPVARMISDFKYQRTPKHPLCDTFIRDFPTFKDYAHHRSAWDKMYVFLRLYPKEPVEDVIRRMERTFTLVGTVEHYELAFRVVTALCGQQETPTISTNQSPAGIFEPSAADISEARAANVIDMEIYTHFAGLWSDARNIVEQKLTALACSLGQY
ncbi:MAG: sulfotransferase family 2 domain-containing protein [Hyphomicrobiales bacterium]|nr:sulfotransferase family 2 domain-containing protein [Hyphomicrobiales bacterium]